MRRLIHIPVLFLLMLTGASGFAQVDSANKTLAEEYLRLCKLYYARFDFDEAIKYGKQAIELDTASSDYHLWLGIAYSEKTKKGWFMKKLSNARKSKKAFEKGVELEPTSVAAKEGAIEYYLRAPGIAGGGVDKAMRLAAEISKIDPARGHLAYAYILMHEEDFPRAEEKLLEAVKAADKTDEVYFRLASLYIGKKEYDKAESTLLRAVKLDSGGTAAACQLGWFYISRDKYLKAAEVFENVLAQHPEDIRARFFLAQMYLNLREVDKADELINKIRNINDDFSGLDYLAAQRFLVSGVGLKEGIERLENYIEKDPQESYDPCWAYSHLMAGIVSFGPGWACAYHLKGKLHEAAGNRKQARKDYKQALEYDPTNEKAKSALDRL